MRHEKTTPPSSRPALYDALMWPFERVVLRPWRRRLGSRAAGRVLEIGAGTGSQLRWYGSAANVTALEPDGAMAARAWRRAARGPACVRLVIGSAEDLPFAAFSFDTVVFTFAFCSIREPALVLAEVDRVLSSGGRLLMLEHVHVPWQPGRSLQRVVAPRWAAAAGGCRLDRDTVHMVREAGFEVLEVRRHALQWIIELVARKQSPLTPK